MAGGRLCCLSGLFTYSSVLLLGLCLCGMYNTTHVEASSCPHVMIHKKVGDTVEFSSCLPPEGVTEATWTYKELTIARKDNIVSENHQFRDRLYLNPTNFSLTVKSLTLQDSGDFSFVSEANGQQRPTVKVTLQVHAIITKQPVLTSNFTWHSSNESCTFWLECSTAFNVSYNWTVRNQTRSGSRLQYVLRAEDGDTEFTCTIYNSVSEMSASKTVQCSNETIEQPGTTDGQKTFIILAAAAGGGCLIIIILGIVVGVCYCKKSQPGSDLNDLTVYADISEVVSENESSTMKPCSVYETIDNRVPSVTPGPQTVYDKIQLNRVRESSVSPYQEIS